MAAEEGSGNRMYVNVGDVIRLHLPHSKVCIDWGVAGRAVNVEFGRHYVPTRVLVLPSGGLGGL